MSILAERFRQIKSCRALNAYVCQVGLTAIGGLALTALKPEPQPIQTIAGQQPAEIYLTSHALKEWEFKIYRKCLTLVFEGGIIKIIKLSSLTNGQIAD